MRSDKVGKDTDFKEKQFKWGNKILSKSELVNAGEFYCPDVFLKKQDKEFIILEHSSTGDRKVHIGELAQVLVYAKDNPDKKFTYILVLDNTSKDGPTVKREKQRLKFYYDKLFCDKKVDNLKIYIIDIKSLDGYENNLMELTEKEKPIN